MSLCAQQPLSGQTILVTRAADQAEELQQALADLGAVVVLCPLVRSEALPGARLPGLARYDWLFLTSPNAVRFLRDRLEPPTATKPVRLPASLRLAVVGPGTARAAAALLGAAPELRPETATGADLAAACRAAGLPAGVRVLRVRGDLAGTEVEDALRDLGAIVEVCTLYRTVAVAPTAEATDLVARGQIASVTFASGSAIESFEAGFAGHRLHGSAVAACLGPVTARAAARYRWRRIVTAEEPTVAAMAAALIGGLAAD